VVLGPKPPFTCNFFMQCTVSVRPILMVLWLNRNAKAIGCTLTNLQVDKDRDIGRNRIRCKTSCMLIEVIQKRQSKYYKQKFKQDMKGTVTE
jgi:hypothetical protein